MKIAKYTLPSNGVVYKPKNPFQAKVIETELLVDTGENHGEVVHMVLDIKGSKISYIEGQSIGILPIGTRKNGKPHKIRLYSIASSSQGDRGDGNTVSLCVKRLLETHPETGFIYQGLASNYLCELKKGDMIHITGPVGRAFSLPQDDSLHLLLFSVGTGIAPFRAFLHFIYYQKKCWKGRIILITGAKTKEELLYLNSQRNDLECLKEKGLQIYTACSREEKNHEGERLYVQDLLSQHQEEIFPLIRQGLCSIYICGLIGMEKGIENSFRLMCNANGMKWENLKNQLCIEGKWNVEVY